MASTSSIRVNFSLFAFNECEKAVHTPDVEALKDFFERKFKVRPSNKYINNRNRDEILRHLKQIGTDSVADKFDVFFFIFLTTLVPSEKDECVLKANDENFTLQEVYDKLSTPSLVARPKVFLIQADDKELESEVGTKGTKPLPEVIKLPADVNRLLLFSRIPTVPRPEADVSVSVEGCSFLVRAFIRVLKSKESRGHSLQDLTCYINNEFRKEKEASEQKDKVLPDLSILMSFTENLYLDRFAEVL